MHTHHSSHHQNLPPRIISDKTLLLRCLSQVVAAPVVELDEEGRGCSVETELGLVSLGDLCIIAWEYEDYGTLFISYRHHHHHHHELEQGWEV